MNRRLKNRYPISRRNVLSILGTSLFIPFLGFGVSTKDEKSDAIEEYQTLLKPDGTIVKVKSSILNKSKIIKRNITNKSFRSWLKK